MECRKGIEHYQYASIHVLGFRVDGCRHAIGRKIRHVPVSVMCDTGLGWLDSYTLMAPPGRKGRSRHINFISLIMMLQVANPLT